MKYKISLFVIILFFSEAKSQGLSSLPDGKKLCWEYIAVTAPFKASIIKYFPNDLLCGRFPSASIAIIKLNNGDTIRVIQHCSWSSDIKPGDIMTITPFKHNDTKNMVYPTDDDALTCRIPRTVDAGLIKYKVSE